MKKLIGLFLMLAFIFAGIYGPSTAYGFEEKIYMFQTMDDPAVPYDPAVLERAPFWNDEWDSSNPPSNFEAGDVVVPLGASLWAVNTRCKDGKIVKEKVRQIGTGTAVAVIAQGSEFVPFESAPFYIEASVDGLDFTACGECIVTNNFLPMEFMGEPYWGIVLVGCNLIVEPDPERGIIGGSAISNSVFKMLPNPLYQTGSFWTLRLLTE